MFREAIITDVIAREILDSRGNPTVEVEVTADGTYTGRASVPSGASTGRFEAVELRDQEERYRGLGVQKAVSNVNQKIRKVLIGENVLEQRKIDLLIKELDGTENKENLGANAVLGASMAAAKAAANVLHIPLWVYLGGSNAYKMPVPMMNILNGGRHADNSIDFQEFMIVPLLAGEFKQALRIGSEIYHVLKLLCKEKNLSTGIGDEGGFAPDISSTEAVLELLVEAILKSGFLPGKDIGIAIDAAASEIYDKSKNVYLFEGEGRQIGKTVVRDSAEMIGYYERLIEQFPIVSIEDGLFEDDWDGWKLMTGRIGNRIQLVGDDLFVTNTKRLEAGIHLGAANAILVKINQIGTLSEAFDAVEMAKCGGFQTIISHRSGETEETMIADIAVALNAAQIKTGAPCRSDRTAKYNQLLRIEEILGVTSVYASPYERFHRNH